MSNKSLVFGGGIPTAPDVALLVKAFGVPQVGVLMTYGAIEGIISCKYKTPRFQTILNAWRAKLYKDNNLITVAVPGRGIKVATPSERVSGTSDRFKSGLRRIGKAVDIADRTDSDGLTPEEIRVKDHISRTGASLRLAAATAAKQLKFQ